MYLFYYTKNYQRWVVNKNTTTNLPKIVRSDDFWHSDNFSSNKKLHNNMNFGGA